VVSVFNDGGSLTVDTVDGDFVVFGTSLEDAFGIKGHWVFSVSILVEVVVVVADSVGVLKEMFFAGDTLLPS
jgi:hypothetical protein